MGAPYIPDPKKFSKYLMGMSYNTCDKMIKIPPAKKGLKYSQAMMEGGGHKGKKIKVSKKA